MHFLKMQNKNHVFELLLVPIIYRILRVLEVIKNNNAKSYKILPLVIMRLWEHLSLFIPRFAYSFINMCYVKLVKLNIQSLMFGSNFMVFNQMKDYFCRTQIRPINSHYRFVLIIIIRGNGSGQKLPDRKIFLYIICEIKLKIV